MTVLRRHYSEELDLTHYSPRELEALALRQRELDRSLRAPTRDPRILRRQDLGPGPLDGIPQRGGGGRFNPPGWILLLVADDGTTQASTAFAGAATGSITKSGSTCTLTDAGVFGGNAGRAKGSTLSVRGWSAGNNGDFTIGNSSVTNAVTYDNPAGVVEAAPGGSSWSTLPCVDTVVDRRSGFTFTSPAPSGNVANAWGRNTTLLPGKTVWSTGLTTSNSFNCRYMESTAAGLLTPFLAAASPFTWMQYVYVVTYSNTPALAIWREVAWGGATTRYARMVAQGAAQIYSRVGASSTSWSITYAPATSTWFTFCYTYDGTGNANALKLYIDGALAAQDANVRSTVAIASLASFSLTSITNAVAATAGTSGALMATRAAMLATTAWDAKTVQDANTFIRNL